MEKCINCKYYREGICAIPMWVEGGLVHGTPVKEDDRCWLFDPGFVQQEKEEKQ